jgi:hypothetical protein
MSPNSISALIASRSRNHATPRAKSCSTSLQSAQSPSDPVKKNRHAVKLAKKYRGRFRGVRNDGLRRSHCVHSYAETTKSYAQRAATTRPVAKTFPQRALQNDLPPHAVQCPAHRSLAALTASHPISGATSRTAPPRAHGKQRPSRWGPRGGRRPTLEGPGARSAPAVHAALRAEHPEDLEIGHGHVCRDPPQR